MSLYDNLDNNPTSPPLFQYSEEEHACGDWLGSSHECPAGQGEQNDAAVPECVPKGHA